MMKKRLLTMLVLLVAVVSGAWATTPNSIVINGTPQVGDKSISLTYYFDPANVPGINSYIPTLKVKCAADNKWDETNLSLHEISSGTTTISLNTLGEFEAGKTYEVCFAYNNGNWVDEVFQSFVPAGPATYTITLAEGTEDADKWTIEPAEAAEGAPVTVTYNGSKKVKSVKAVKKGGAEPADNTYLKWDDGQKKLVATPMPAPYNTVESANADVNWAAGTYVVDGEVTINGTITLEGNVNLIIKDGAKLTANLIVGDDKNLSIFGQAQMTGELVVNYSDNDVITSITTLEVHSAKVTAGSSSSYFGGFYNISTFNVYGGLVDAKGTAGTCFGIGLKEGGSMNIYGGDVKAEGKGSSDSYSSGILCDNSDNKATVTVYGGKLWAGNADKKAFSFVNLQKGAGFTGKIETSADNSAWTEYTDAATPETKYVRVGY